MRAHLAVLSVTDLAGDELIAELRRVRLALDNATAQLEREHETCEGAFCSCRIGAQETIDKQKQLQQRERAICERLLRK